MLKDVWVKRGRGTTTISGAQVGGRGGVKLMTCQDGVTW